MEEMAMRVYLSKLETRIDAMLKLWKKHPKIEYGESIQLEWQFDGAQVFLDIFYEDLGERLILNCFSQRRTIKQDWHGFSKKTEQQIVDRIGNFAQVAMYRGFDARS